MHTLPCRDTTRTPRGGAAFAHFREMMRKLGNILKSTPRGLPAWIALCVRCALAASVFFLGGYYFQRCRLTRQCTRFSLGTGIISGNPFLPRTGH